MGKILKTDKAGDLAAALEPFSQLEFVAEAPMVREEERADLLAQFRAGELDDLAITIIATTEIDRPRPLPYSQRKKATANFTRFRIEEFPEFAGSFADQPFLRDHSRRSEDNGGLIVTSAADQKRKVHFIRQEVLLLKPWAMEDAIVGTMRSFSIGWRPRERGVRGFIESAWCTVCDAPMFGAETDCSHWPGDVVKLGERGKKFIVELEWRNVIGIETSEVTFPAASGTGIESDLRALAQLVECTPNAARPPKESKEPEMDPQLLAALGLPPDATPEQAAAAASAMNQRAQEADVARAAAETAAAEAKRKAEADAAAARAAQIETMRQSALSAGKFTVGSEREKLFFELAEQSVALAEKQLATWPDASEVPVAADSKGNDITQTGEGRREFPDGYPGTRGAPLQPQPYQLRAEPGIDERDRFQTHASAWLLQRAGVSQMVREAHKKLEKPIDLDPGPFRGLSFVDLARHVMSMAGVDTFGMDRMQILGRALAAGRELEFTSRAGGSFNTTSDFAVLLENTMHKVLLGAYMTTDDTWSLFCGKGSVSDFRPHNRYRLGSFGRLTTKNEAGEFRQQNVPDAEKELISAQSKGNIVGVTRETLIDDDMGAFSRIPMQLGRAAKLSVEIDVYDTLKLNSGLGPAMNDGKTLFHADHNNVGAGAALTTAALDDDRVILAEQKDPSGNEILDMRPQVLVVPIGLGGLARNINKSKWDFDAIDPGTDEQNKFMKPNEVEGLFRNIVDTARLTGTRRYMFVNPDIVPVIEVAFLDGQEMPFLDLRDGWRIDGVEWKVRLDYGVGGVDFRGAVTDAGA